MIGRWKSIVWSPKTVWRNDNHSLFCVDVTGNSIDEAEAVVLAEALKEMRELKDLNLDSEFWVVAISHCGDSDAEVA